MKRSVIRRATVSSLGCILILAALVILVTIVYGNIFKMRMVEQALGIELPNAGQIVDYSYIPGRLSATLTFQKNQYETIRKTLRAKQMECYFCEISRESVLLLEIPHTGNKQLEMAEYFVGSESSDNFCGVLNKTEDETILYVAQPSHAIAEKWRRQRDGSFVLANLEKGDEISSNSGISK